MKAAVITVGVALVVVLAACSSSEPSASSKPATMPKVEGLRLDVAKSAIKRAGYANEVKVVGGGTFGVVMESNWTVCEQSPGEGDRIEEQPRLVVDRSCPNSTTTSTAETKAERTTTTAPAPPTTTTKPKPVLPAVITPANNADLAAVMAEGDNCSETIGAFAQRYAGKIIEFDGNIGNVAPHGSYATRFDFLVGVGDFDPDRQPGPSFQFRDMNASYDLHLTGPNIPDSVTAGLNLHIKAEIGEYDPTTCLFQLTPISTQVR